MTQNIDLHKLAKIVGWNAKYEDAGCTSYEYVQTIKNVESLHHVLKLYNDLTYDTYRQTFDAIIGVLPKKLNRKICKLTKKCDPNNLQNVLDLACFEIEEYRAKTDYSKLYNYGKLLNVDIEEQGYKFCYDMPKAQKRKILSLIECNLPVELAPTLGKIKKIDYKIGYIKQNSINS